MTAQNALATLWEKSTDSEKEYINALLADQRTLRFILEKLEGLFGATREHIEESRMKETV